MTQKHSFKDTILSGILLSLGSEVAVALLLSLGLILAHQPIEPRISWYAACYLPPILLLRHFARTQQHPVITKTIATLLFLTFIPFMYFLISHHILNFK